MHDHIAADPKFQERFQRETLLMARFQHPYVVTLYDASLNDPQGPCIVMEYIRGITLDSLLLRNKRLNPARTGRLLGQLCEALQAAHAEGIVHRDLKPTNLMVVDPDTPYEKIKVMDFGLAKLVESRGAMYKNASDTGADFAVGTPGYISPEQVKGEEMDHRSDLYSVGIILFELLTGALPFTREETMDVLLAHATEPAPSFSEVGASSFVPREIEAVVMSCLEKNPTDRPASAMNLAEAYDTAMARANGELAPEAPPAEPQAPPPPSTPQAATVVYDPQNVIHHMEAWMPEAIAAYKLKGFVHDFNGEVVESVPGMIRVQLDGAGQTYNPNGPLSWFAFRKKSDFVEMELRLERTNPAQQSQLHITVIMRAVDRKTALNQAWRDRCNYLFCELRGYLAGASV